MNCSQHFLISLELFEFFLLLVPKSLNVLYHIPQSRMRNDKVGRALSDGFSFNFLTDRLYYKLIIPNILGSFFYLIIFFFTNWMQNDGLFLVLIYSRFFHLLGILLNYLLFRIYRFLVRLKWFTMTFWVLNFIFTSIWL